MTNYVQFINAMLELRNQRLREAIEEAQMQQQAAQQLGSGIGDMFSSIGKYAMKSKQDAMANSLMNEYYGGAGNVPTEGLSFGGAKSLGAGGSLQGPGRQFTGGTDELGLRMKLADQRSEMLNRSLDNERADTQLGISGDNLTINAIRELRLQKEAEARAKQKRDKEAADALANADKKIQSNLKNNNSWIKGQQKFEADLAEAQTPEQAKSLAEGYYNFWSAHKSAGVDVGDAPPPIRPFLTPEQKTDIITQRDNLSAAQKSLIEAQTAPPSAMDKFRSSLGMTPDTNIPILGPVTYDSEKAIAAAQAKVAQEQERLKGYEGMGIPIQPPMPQGTSPAAAAPAPSGAPTNTRRNPATGEIQKFINGQWVTVR